MGNHVEKNISFGIGYCSYMIPNLSQSKTIQINCKNEDLG